MPELRQLEPGEMIRVIFDGVPVKATVTKHESGYCVYYRFSDVSDDHSLRHQVFAAGEEPRLIKRLRYIADDAMRSMRRIQEEITEAEPCKS